MIKAGSDIDSKRNYRIRGIVPVDNGDYIYLGISQGTRPPKAYFKNMSEKEFKDNFPYENYIHIDACFRVDVPEDKYNNYSLSYKNFNSKSFRSIDYTSENILNLCRTFNKKISEVELVKKDYIDKFEDEMGFYDLYDERLSYSLKPIEILFMNKDTIKLKMHYHCTNYNNTVDFDKIVERYYTKGIDSLKKEYGKEFIDSLIESYNNELDR